MIKVPLLRHQRHISPSPLTLTLQHQRQNVPEKLSGYHIHTKYCKFDHSEMIFGPFEKMKHPLFSACCEHILVLFERSSFILHCAGVSAKSIQQ